MDWKTEVVSVPGYQVLEHRHGIETEDVRENDHLVRRIVHKIWDSVLLFPPVAGGGDPAVDFPVGSICTVGSFSGRKIDSVEFTGTSHRVTFSVA